MNVRVFSRSELVGRGGSDGPAALLLEGSWARGGSDKRWSLDDAIDGRFEWVDLEASRLAEQAAAAGEADGLFPPAAWLDALALRYYLVKLLRVVAFFRQCRPLSVGDRVRLTATRGADEDYAHVLSELCRLEGVQFHVEWTERPLETDEPFPPNGRSRRWAGALARLVGPPAKRRSSRPRVVLCGNPRLLDPVCQALLKRNCRVWWLYDRFAFKSWLRWRGRGVGQLVLNTSLGRQNRIEAAAVGPLEHQGIDLAKPVAQWLSTRMGTHGCRLTRAIETIDSHFRSVRPDRLVLDEDATPLARSAVAIGRSHGATSFVVQHGVPGTRFGFAPLAADRILAWGESSRRQLESWGVPAGQIEVTGSPRHDVLCRTLARTRRKRRRSPSVRLRSPRVLLLATVPPRDKRPDAVRSHLTRRSYVETLRMAARSLVDTPLLRLTVRPHPRAADDPALRKTLARERSLQWRVDTKSSLEALLGKNDCVLSCASSAGIDATLAGLPVIQLLPPGSGNIIPHDEWGLLGSARTKEELDELLGRAFGEQAAESSTRSLQDMADAFFGLEDMGPGRSSVDRMARSILGTY